MSSRLVKNKVKYKILNTKIIYKIYCLLTDKNVHFDTAYKIKLLNHLHQ